MSNLKVEGKVGDFCLNCKNCKAVTRIHDGKNASIRIIEVDCEDLYDGMVKTLDVDSDICCSMFEPNSPCDKISILQHELEMDRLRRTIHQLEKEKAAHMKGIERLKKSQEKLQNQVKNLQTNNEESYKREEKLEDKVHKLERSLHNEKERARRLDTEFLMPLAHVLYPGEKVCKPYSEVLKDIKLLNKGVYDLEEDNKRLADKSKALSGEYDDILAKDIEIKSLQDKYEAAMTGWRDAIDTNDKMIGEKDKQIEELARRYNTIAKKLNDIHDILKEDETNE